MTTLRIATAQGLVPVSNFIKRTAIPKVASITRRNGVYTMNVAANLTEGTAADKKIEQVKKWEATQTYPSDVKIVYAGADEQNAETGRLPDQGIRRRDLHHLPGAAA